VGCGQRLEAAVGKALVKELVVDLRDQLVVGSPDYEHRSRDLREALRQGRQLGWIRAYVTRGLDESIAGI
jgi:hypothetical protein